MSEEKILGLDDLLARKVDTSVIAVKQYLSKELGGILEFNKIPLNRILFLMSSSNINNIKSAFELNCMLIYETCPLFQCDSISEKFNKEEPCEIVKKIFNDNIGEITEIGSVVLSMYGLGEELKEDIKK